MNPRAPKARNSLRPWDCGFTVKIGSACNPEQLALLSNRSPVQRSAEEAPGGWAMRVSPHRYGEAEWDCPAACRSSGFL
jgi:hypothetical protein